MSIVQMFDANRFLDLCGNMSIAFILATLIGVERQMYQRIADLRTIVLVAVGAAALVTLGMRLNGQAGAVRIAAYVVSGVGFLGTGVILKQGAQVSGLNTAATLWCSAAVGALSGIGLAAEATVLTVAVFACNYFLRPLVDAINRAPIDERKSEAIYEVQVVTAPETVGEVRDRLVDVLEKANYPVRQTEVFERSPEATEIIATLVSTAVDPGELDAVTGVLEQSPHVSFASWSSSLNE